MGYLSNMAKIMPSLRNRTPVTISPAEASDNFNGIDDDPPDTSKWIATNAPVIASDKLRMDVGGGGVTDIKMIKSKYWIHGDFDVEVKWNWRGYHLQSAWSVNLRAQGATAYWYEQYRGSNFRYIIYTHAGSGPTWNSYTRVSSGIRLVRISGVVHMYRWSTGNNSWGEHSDSPLAGSDSTEPVQISMWVQSWAGDYPLTEIDFDNFIVNSADLITVP